MSGRSVNDPHVSTGSAACTPSDTDEVLRLFAELSGAGRAKVL
ncbi:MAG TPA: hypothetical protein VF855_06005 [Acidimicrobiales bacterium]